MRQLSSVLFVPHSESHGLLLSLCHLVLQLSLHCPPRYASAQGQTLLQGELLWLKQLSQHFASAYGCLWGTDVLAGCFGILVLPGCCSSPKQTCPALEDDSRFGDDPDA